VIIIIGFHCIFMGEMLWVILKCLFIPGTLENADFWIIWILSFHPNSKSVSACLGRALQVLFLPLSGSGCTTSSCSLLLLLLNNEFT
jgi:hypothetical protein